MRLAQWQTNFWSAPAMLALWRPAAVLRAASRRSRAAPVEGGSMAPALHIYQVPDCVYECHVVRFRHGLDMDY